MKLGTSSIIAAVPVGVYCLLLLLLIGTGTSTVNACTLDGCDHPDCGSCGNACCSLLITVEESTEAVMHKLNASITEEGGPDQLYIPMMTASGTLTFSDLRQYGAGADFLGQALHTTLNGKYNDTVNFSLSPTTVLSKNNKKKQKKKKGTIISAFSISDIAGAYCDSGQNYWNILQLIEGIAWDNDETPLIEHVGESCPTTATTASKTPPRAHKHNKEQEQEDTNNDGSSEEEEPEDTSFSSEEEEDTDSASSSFEDDTIPETTTTDDNDDVDGDDDTDDGSTENNFNALSMTMDTSTTTTTDPLLRPLSMGKHVLIVVVGLLFLVSGSFALVLMRKNKQQAQRTSATAHSTSSFRENYGRL